MSRIHRVAVAELGDVVTVTGTEAAHLERVLRVRPGQRVRAFDGTGLEAEGVISAISPGRVTLELEPARAAANEARLAVTVCTALLKGDKLADVIRMCTELGAVAFRPFISRHCDVRELSERKLQRLQRVSAEAAKQSGRAVIPPVQAAVSFSALAGQLDSEGGTVVYADPRARTVLAEAVAGSEREVQVLTGPEGGFSEDELEQLAVAGAQGVRLGARILRAETAPVALTAALLLPEAL